MNSPVHKRQSARDSLNNPGPLEAGQNYLFHRKTKPIQVIEISKLPPNREDPIEMNIGPKEVQMSELFAGACEQLTVYGIKVDASGRFFDVKNGAGIRNTRVVGAFNSTPQ